MAKIKFGLVVTDARGKAGGMVYSKNKYGGYVRTKVTPVNPRTTKQQASRAQFGIVSGSWRGISDAQRQQFIEQAPNYSRTNIFGDNAPLTGQALYQKLNNNLLVIGVAMTNTCPPPLTVDGASYTGVALSVGGPTMSLLNLSATAADESIEIFATAPQSSGVNFVGKSKYRLIHVKGNGTAAGTLAVGGFYATVFGIAVADLTVGTKIGFMVKRVSEVNGQPSTELGSINIVAA